MKPCPYCKDKPEFTNVGYAIHIGRMHKDKAPKPETVIGEMPKPETSRFEGPTWEEQFQAIKDELTTLNLQEDVGLLSRSKAEAVRAELRERLLELKKQRGQVFVKPKVVYKVLKPAMPESEQKTQEEKHKTTLAEEGLAGIIPRLRNMKKEQPEIGEEIEIPQTDKSYDPEPLLENITRIPFMILGIILFYVWWDNPAFYGRLLNNEWVDLYVYLFVHIKDIGSMIILILSAVMLTLGIFLVHKLVWRLAFKDMQIRNINNLNADGTKDFGPGTSFAGRIYLTIGAGMWDRLYRRITKKPTPEIVTIYYRRGLRDPVILNPLKILQSCHKGYLRNTDGNRFIYDGLFKRTIVARHMRRDNENNSTVYWFEDEIYDAKKFMPDWYDHTHGSLIEDALDEVTQACAMDSSIQKDQLRNVAIWLPQSEVSEHNKVYELKLKKMDEERAKVSR